MPPAPGMWKYNKQIKRKKEREKKGEEKKEEGASDIYINPSSFFLLSDGSYTRPLPARKSTHH